MSKLLKAIAVLFVAIVAAYFFLIDGLIKTQLEREGSRALQSPLTIGTATFHLLPTSLTLRDVRIGNARVPTHNLALAEEVAIPLSLRDLLAHKFIVDTIAVHGLRFNRPRAEQNATVETASATNSPQLREALERAQRMLDNPLASNTVASNASITGALLAEQFKPLLVQIAAALHALSAPAANLGDWRILVRRVNIDGALDFGSNAVRFVGSLDNVTPQPALFDAVTQFDVRSADGETAKLQAAGNLDRRKLARANLRFDLTDFALSNWPLSRDAELKITVVAAKANVQTLLTLTGNQFDLNALLHFQNARFDVATGDNAVARVVADVVRQTNAFDINLQASGSIAAPALTMNSSLDVPLANAIRQLQPAIPAAAPFPVSP